MHFHVCPGYWGSQSQAQYQVRCGGHYNCPHPNSISSASPLPSLANRQCLYFCCLVEKDWSPAQLRPVLRGGSWLFKPNQIAPHLLPQWLNQCQSVPGGLIQCWPCDSVQAIRMFAKDLGKKAPSSVFWEAFPKPAHSLSWMVGGLEAWDCCRHLAVIREATLRMQPTNWRERKQALLSSHKSNWMKPNLWTFHFHVPVNPLYYVSHFELGFITCTLESKWR